MDINPKHMDELFQRAAEGFRPEAPEHSWPEIEKRIRRKKKKGIGFWLSIASLFLIVGGAGAWIIMSPSSSISNEPNAAGTTTSFSSRKNSQQLTSISASKNIPQLTSIPQNAPINSNVKSNLLRNSASSNRSPKAKILATLPNSFPISTSKTSLVNNQFRKKSASTGNVQIENDYWDVWGQKSSNKKPFLRRRPTWKNEDFQASENESWTEQTGAENVQLMDITPELWVSLNSKTPRLASQWKSTPIEWKVEEEPITQEKTKKNLFDQMPGPSWGFVFQPEYVNNWEQLRSAYLQNQNGNPVITPVDPNFRSSLNSLNHNVGFSMAVQSRFAIDLKSSFDLGLSYGFRNDRQNYFECFNPSTGESKLYFQPLTGWNCTAQTFGNTYHYVSMPVGMTHALTGNAKSSGFRLHWNLVPQFLVAGKSMTFDFGRDGFVSGAISKNDVYRRTGLTAGLGLGYAVKMNARSLLETGIQWNGNWSTMFNEYYPVDKRFGAIGARIGLVFK